MNKSEVWAARSPMIIKETVNTVYPADRMLESAERQMPMVAQPSVRREGFYRSFDISLPTGSGFIFKGRSSMVPGYYGPAIERQIAYSDADIASQDFVILGSEKDSKFLLIGAVTAKRSLCYLTTHVRNKRFESVSVSQPEIPQDGVGEKLVVIEARDWRDLLFEYRQMVLKEMNDPHFEPPRGNHSISGYCSWYYRYQNITEQEFRDDLESLRAVHDILKLTVVQIDDGYQSSHGDWLSTNSNWPSSLFEIGSLIKESGFIPGIWTMPLLASTASTVYRDHPDWFVKDHFGQIIHIPGWSPPPEDVWACLDVSNPMVKQHLFVTYSKLYESGFRYFKLDGLGLSYPSGSRCDANSTAISALREGIQIIRSAVGTSRIMSCGIPFLASVGIVDQVRMSADTAPRWRSGGVPDGSSSVRLLNDWEEQDPTVPSLYSSLRQTLDNWWMFDYWYQADPDVVIARDSATELTEGEARMSALVAIMTGVSFTSDPIGTMSSGRIALLARACTLRVATGMRWLNVPDPNIEIFEGLLEGRKCLCIFNFGRKEIVVSQKELGMEPGMCEMLHPLGVIEESVKIGGHDAILIVESSSCE